MSALILSPSYSRINFSIFTTPHFLRNGRETVYCSATVQQLRKTRQHYAGLGLSEVQADCAVQVIGNGKSSRHGFRASNVGLQAMATGARFLRRVCSGRSDTMVQSNAARLATGHKHYMPGQTKAGPRTSAGRYAIFLQQGD